MMWIFPKMVFHVSQLIRPHFFGYQPAALECTPPENKRRLEHGNFGDKKLMEIIFWWYLLPETNSSHLKHWLGGGLKYFLIFTPT